MCHIQKQIAVHANSTAHVVAEKNSDAVINMFNTSVGDFSNKQIELYEAIDQMIKHNPSELNCLIQEILANESGAKKKLEQLIKESALSLNDLIA